MPVYSELPLTIRATAGENSGRLRYKPARDPYITMLESRNAVELRRTAAYALRWQIEDPIVLSALVTAMSDVSEDVTVRVEAISSMTYMYREQLGIPGYSFPQGYVAEKIVPPLQRLRNDASLEIRAATMEALRDLNES